MTTRYNETGERFQLIRQQALLPECIATFLDKMRRAGDGAVHPEKRRIRALAELCIPPRDFPQTVGRGGHVEHVIHYLERKSDAFAVSAQRSDTFC